MVAPIEAKANPTPSHGQLQGAWFATCRSIPRALDVQILICETMPVEVCPALLELFASHIRLPSLSIKHPVLAEGTNVENGSHAHVITVQLTK